MTGLGAALLSIMMIAVFALLGGGLHGLLRKTNRKQGLLMVAAGLVLLGNVLIWTL